MVVGYCWVPKKGTGRDRTVKGSLAWGKGEEEEEGGGSERETGEGDFCSGLLYFRQSFSSKMSEGLSCSSSLPAQ